MARPAKPLEERFWSHVERGDNCWVWTGTHREGYGFFWVSDTYPYYRRAHRVAWELTNGSIPDGMVVCHKCDNPPCVRPDHLFLGTDSDNHQDAVTKGRAGNGLQTHCRNGHPLPEGMGRCEICRVFRTPKTGIKYRPVRRKH